MFTRENRLKPKTLRPYSQSSDTIHLNEFYNIFNPTPLSPIKKAKRNFYEVQYIFLLLISKHISGFSFFVYLANVLEFCACANSIFSFAVFLKSNLTADNFVTVKFNKQFVKLIYCTLGNPSLYINC
jgi:hypothetical protein